MDFHGTNWIWAAQCFTIAGMAVSHARNAATSRISAHMLFRKRGERFSMFDASGSKIPRRCCMPDGFMSREGDALFASPQVAWAGARDVHRFCR